MARGPDPSPVRLESSLQVTGSASFSGAAAASRLKAPSIKNFPLYY